MQDTGKLIEDLKLCDDFKTFYDENKQYMVADTLSTLLSNLAKEIGLNKAEIFRRAELSEVYGYQIFSGIRIPDRKKLLCLALGMGLTLEQTQMLLRTAGYAPLYIKLPDDSIVMYGICKNMTVAEVNMVLFEYGYKTLG